MSLEIKLATLYVTRIPLPTAIAKHQMAERVTHGQTIGARSGGRAKTMTHGLAQKCKRLGSHVTLFHVTRCLPEGTLHVSSLKDALAPLRFIASRILWPNLLDINRRLICCFSFTVKLVNEIMRASWGSLCDFPKLLPIDVIASEGKLCIAFSYVTAIIDGMDQRENPYSCG